jgi:hypothetical protein
MKIFKMMLMVWALASTGVMAQDYYAPTDKEKEPVARFRLDEIKIKTEPNGEKYINYELPETLTGERNVIVASEVKLPGLDKLPVRIFSGPNATVTCMGTDDKPGCMVTHKNLKLNPVLAEVKINETYYDPEQRSAALLVVKEFQNPVAHSGNQPIGVLGGLKPRSAKAELPIAGTWISRYEIADGKQMFAKLTLEKDTLQGNFRFSSAVPANAMDWDQKPEGKISGVKYFGNRVIGRWTAGGRSGWFEFTFNNAKTRFEGFYGVGDNGSARVGRWTSVSAR